MAPRTMAAGFSLAHGAPLMLIAALLMLAPAVQGRKLLQSSVYTPITCDVSNVIFTQDAACPYNIPNPQDGFQTNLGLWQSNFQHTCPFPLTSLTVKLTFGPDGLADLQYSTLYGLTGGPTLVNETTTSESGSLLPRLLACPLNADGTSATCQVSPSAQFNDGTVLGNLPLQEGANYAIWYTSQAHPCGSTNNAPLWISPIAATFAIPSQVTYEVARNTDIDNANILLYGIPSTFDSEAIGTISGKCYNEGTLRESGVACMTACDSWNGQRAQQPELQLPQCEAVVYVPANSARSDVQTCCFLKSSNNPNPQIAPGIDAYKKV